MMAISDLSMFISENGLSRPLRAPNSLHSLRDYGRKYR